MNKRDLLVPFVVAGVAIAFVAVCALVIVTRNHPKWVQRKLKVGALLLSLTAVASCGDETVTCYVQPPSNVLEVEDQSAGETIPVDLATDDNLDATVAWRDGESFSYRITAPDGTELARGDLDAADGAFDENDEEFVIPLPTSMVAGSNTLEMFDVAADQQPNDTSWQWALEVTD